MVTEELGLVRLEALYPRNLEDPGKTSWSGLWRGFLGRLEEYLLRLVGHLQGPRAFQ